MTSNHNHITEKGKSQQIVLGKLNSCMQKNENGSLSNSTHKNLKWIKNLNVARCGDACL